MRTAPSIADLVCRPRVTPETVIAEAGALVGLSGTELLSRCRGRRHVVGRQLAMYALRELTPLSYPEIAKIFNRDHTTVIAGVRRVRGAIAASPDTADHINQLITRLGQA